MDGTKEEVEGRRRRREDTGFINKEFTFPLPPSYTAKLRGERGT